MRIGCRMTGLTGAGKSDQSPCQLILEISDCRGFAAYPCAAGTARAARGLFTLKTKHFLFHINPPAFAKI